jgi:hypothetical protein
MIVVVDFCLDPISWLGVSGILGAMVGMQNPELSILPLHEIGIAVNAQYVTTNRRTVL